MNSDVKPRLINFDDIENAPLVEDPEGGADHDDSSSEINCSWPPRKQERTVETVSLGATNVISSKFESLDFEKCENHLLLDEERTNGYSLIQRKNLARWFIFLIIGVTVAVIGVFIDITVEELSNIKYRNLKYYVDKCTPGDCLYIPYLIWITSNAILVLIGSIIVAYLEPVALGSGIPQIKCYLNGVKIPRVVRFKTLCVKVFGVILAVVGGLAVGKEGPMIHSGAVVGAGLSQGKSSTFGFDLGIFRYFREDHEKRDFVSGGAAGGVSAAFGAPVGGVLFSLEEGASFLYQSLTWKMFFCSLVSTFSLNILLSTYHGHPGELQFSGLLNFGKFDVLSYQLVELPIYMAMGVFGGMLGALFNYTNFKLTVFRIRYVKQKWVKVVEAVIVAIVTATIGFLSMYFINDCRPLGEDPTKYPVQMYCGDGEYNALASLWFQTPEASVRSLFHDPLGSHRFLSLLVFFLFYLFLSCWTYGVSVSSGVFIPSLLTGAAWGRLWGMAIGALLPGYSWTDPGKYAVIGAAAQLGGVVRMTLCLTVILIEATGNITFGLPLMITLITAKWTGDYFTEGIYDIHTQLQGVPVLPWEPPPLTYTVYASEVMSYPVTALLCRERVGRIIEILHCETHSGFPVVDPIIDQFPECIKNRVKSYGRLRGLILRHQLIIILDNQFFDETYESWCDKMYNIFRDGYPRYKDINDLHLDAHQLNFHVDLRPFINNAPYSIQHSASLPRVFRLFRSLGLRHLPVVNDRNEVIGMITRKDLARYRSSRHQGRMGYEELKLSHKL